MTHIKLISLIFVALQCGSANAAEGVLCKSWHSDVSRKVAQIKSYGTDLSKMAKSKLLADLQIDTEFCIAECEGDRFKYCNEVSKWLSGEKSGSK